jgi:predicted RNase H-like HicB family nuclease
MKDSHTRPSLEHYLALPYQFSVTPDDGSWFIEYPDLPGCMTQVEDIADIPDAAVEIRELWLESAYESGVDIPEPALAHEFSGKFVARIPKALHRDLAESARKQGVSLNAYVAYLLAERNIVARLMARIDTADSSRRGAFVVTVPT